MDETQSLSTCNLPIDEGHGNDSIEVYGFGPNPAYKECRTFNFRGHGGNDNRFTTQAECVERCITNPNPCELPIDEGFCYAIHHVYGFDGKECKKFIWGGCGKNDNLFVTKAECERTCM